MRPNCAIPFLLGLDPHGRVEHELVPRIVERDAKLPEHVRAQDAALAARQREPIGSFSPPDVA
jgi:hypothetical protein